MAMSYYLVEFEADQSLAVVAREKIEAFSGKEDCVVAWQASGKKRVTKHAAKILKIGGK